jgi:hypothetical protein
MYGKNSGKLVFVSIMMSLMILVHHPLVNGRFFDLRDILHHEYFGMIFFHDRADSIVYRSVHAKETMELF